MPRLCAQRPVRTAAAVAAILGLGLAAPALAGQITVDVTMAKHKSGPYEQMAPEVTVSDRTRNLYVKGKNISDIARRVRLEDISFGERGDFKVRWFRRRHNITQAVKAGDYRIRLRPGEKRVFRTRVEPRVADPGELCLALAFHTRPGADTFDDIGLFYVNSQSVCG